MIRTKRVQAGDWRTVEWYWNSTGTAFFRLPAGARIKVRYGVGWLGWDSQEQTLDGKTHRLSVGRASLLRARMQVNVKQTADVTYDVYPGDVSVTTPSIPF